MPLSISVQKYEDSDHAEIHMRVCENKSGHVAQVWTQALCLMDLLGAWLLQWGVGVSFNRRVDQLCKMKGHTTQQLPPQYSLTCFYKWSFTGSISHSWMKHWQWTRQCKRGDTGHTHITMTSSFTNFFAPSVQLLSPFGLCRHLDATSCLSSSNLTCLLNKGMCK